MGLTPTEEDRLRVFAAAEADWRSVDPNVFHHAKEDLEQSSIRLHEIAIAESLRAGQT